MDVSIVFGTYNRIKWLKDCVASIRQSVGDLQYEIIVADGGSDDGSREFLAVQPDVVFLGERSLDGAVQAFNKGFSLARGWAVCNINDDIIFIGNALNLGYSYLHHHQSHVAQVAFCFDINFNGNFRCSDVIHGKQCANFGICQRLLGEYVGWWGTDYHTYGGDTAIGMKFWEIGWEVHSLDEARVHHGEVQDSLRRSNDAAQHFWAYWTPERISTFRREPLHRDEIRRQLQQNGVKRLW